MSVDAGSAVAYLELDYSKYSAGLLTAKQQLSTFTDNTQEAGTRVQALGGIVTGVGSTLTTGLTVPLVTAGAASLTVAANFEEGMSKVQAISGATAGDMEQLSAKAKELGANTKFSATEASEAFSYMAMAGWKTTDMLNGIDGIMNLAAASGENLALVSDICTDAMTAFGLSADQSARFADVLAAASSNANTNVAMLGESFKYVAPVAGAMGYSVEDTAVALGLMANSGIKASQAGTSLRQILLGLQGGVELATKSTDKWRIEVENSDGSMRNLNDVVVDLRAAFADMTDAQKASNAEAIAGKIGMSGLLAIVNAAETDFNKLTGAIDKSNGVAKKMADTMQNNLKGKVTQLKSALEGAGGQQSVLPRLCRQETPRRRGLPPSVRRISRPVRVQPGFRDRRAGNPVRLQVGQCGDRQRSGQRRGRRQGHLLFRAEHDPLLSRRRADSAQCADLHADVRQGPQGGTRPARRTGHQGCGGSGRLRRRVRLIARPVATRGTGRTHQGRTAPVHRAGGHPIQEHRRGGPRNRTDEPT